MLPNLDINDGLELDFEIGQQPSYTFRLDFDRGRITGHIDGVESIKQSIYLILNTERYEHSIYSWNYGSELRDLIGKPMELVIPESKRLLMEAVMQDDRVTGVESTEVDYNLSLGTLNLIFEVDTIYGKIRMDYVEVESIV